MPNLEWQLEQRMQLSQSTRNVNMESAGGSVGSALDPSVPLSQKLIDYKSQNEQLASQFKQL